MPEQSSPFPLEKSSPASTVRRAVDLVSSGEGAVLLDRMLVVRPVSDGISCEVIDPDHGMHRCAEEYRVLIENAARHLAASALSAPLAHRRLIWRVVEDRAGGMAILWEAS